MTRDEIINVIYEVIKITNLERDASEQIPIDPNVIFMGPEAILDSISLVSIIVDIESSISERVGFEVALTDDDAINQPVPPFTSPNLLADYILGLVSNHAI